MDAVEKDQLERTRNGFRKDGYMGAMRYVVALALVMLGGNAVAQESVMPWEEYDKLISARSSMTTLGPTLFGDSVDLYSGSLSFSVTDISIPGNSRLPVALTRTYQATRRNGYTETSGGNVIGSIADGAMTDWEIDTPNLSGVFATTWPSSRCTSTTPPPGLNISGTSYFPEDYWQGNHANMPGGGEMLVADKGAAKPTSGGPYLWMTSAFTYFSCLPTIKNGPGEGFLAITADGTKYWFDWMAQFYAPGLKSPTGGYDANRRKNVLYATRVEDRFGNWVTYTYSNGSTSPGRLTAIDASDGRRITIQYDAYGHVASASNGQQTWTYGYQYPSPTTGSLSSVTLPDNSRWTLDLMPLSTAKFRYVKVAASQDEYYRDCTNPGDIANPDPFTGTITHPSGAVGQFTIKPERFSRSNVPLLCANYTSIDNNPNDDVAIYALSWDSYALVTKAISGPGLATAQWNYSYTSGATYFYPPSGNGMPVCNQSDGCRAPQCLSDGCSDWTIATVTAPGDKKTKYYFGNSYRYNEGKLIKVDEMTSSDVVLRTTTTSYEFATAGQPFPVPVGSSLQGRGDGFTSEYLRPQRGTVITQDGATFNSKVNGFDSFARPTSVTKWSSLGFSRTENTTYSDQTASWVLGQTRRVVNGDNNEVMAETEFDPTTALPIKQYRFGKLLQTIGYRADGTVETVKDGNNNTTTVSNWKRGIPQTIAYADGTSESAVVSDLGWVMSTTDENGAGFTTSYGYDAMGRINSVTYPAGDTVNWNGKTAVFEAVASAEFGLPAGHWRQTTTQGNYRKTTYFDGLWRPVVEQEQDLADPDGTTRWVARRFDDAGRAVFEAYPRNPFVEGVANFDSLLSGTRTTYDALDRVRCVEQDSELGVLATTTNYLTGFVRQTTNPRGKVTTENFQAYDQPTMDSPVWIELPEGVSTGIVRDAYMKPLDVIRAGPGG